MKRPEATQPEQSSKSQRLTRGARETGPRPDKQSGVTEKKEELHIGAPYKYKCEIMERRDTK
jgi:hypothetical protein